MQHAGAHPTWGDPALASPFALASEAQLTAPADSDDPVEFEWLHNLLVREGVNDPLAQADDEANDTSDVVSDTSDTSNTTCDTFSTGISAPGVKQQLSAGERSSASSSASPSGEEEHGAGHDSKRRKKVSWTTTEDLTILATVRRLGTQWNRIAHQLPGRTPDAVRNRWHRLQKTHNFWDNEEGHAALDALLLSCGFAKDWNPPGLEPEPASASASPGTASPQRIVGSDHGRSMWTADEDAIIREGVRRLGCKWRKVAALLPGRSDSSVRNRWMRLQKERGAAIPSPLGASEASTSPALAPSTVPTRWPSPGSPEHTSSAEPSPAPLPAAELIAAVHAPAQTKWPAPAGSARSLPTVPEGRPAPVPTERKTLTGLKRHLSGTSFHVDKASPSPMQGFDLDLFVDAVTGALEARAHPPGATSARALCSDRTPRSRPRPSACRREPAPLISRRFRGDRTRTLTRRPRCASA